MGSIYALIVSEEGTLTEDTFGDEHGCLAGLQKHVGGLVDVVSLGGEVDMWVNDEGLYLCGPNLLATAIAHRYAQMHGFLLQSRYFGPAVFTGGVDGDGETLSLSPQQAASIRGIVAELPELGPGSDE